MNAFPSGRSDTTRPLWLAWLQLVRLPNLATAVADPLAGFVIVAGFHDLSWLPPAGWLAVLASVCLYAGGMVQNDVVDAEVDQHERPGRPLPSGQIAVGTAALAANGLLAVGGLAACAAAVVAACPAPAFVGAVLTVAIWVYNRHAKGTLPGTVVMGSCRGLNWLLGMTAAGWPAGTLWLLPIGMGLYVTGITIFARDEVEQGRRRLLLLGTAVMLGGLVLAGAVPGQALANDTLAAGMWVAGGRLPAWLSLWSVLAVVIVTRCLQAVLDPSPRRMQAAIGNAIMAIITLDAVVVLAFCGEAWAIAIFMLLAWFVLGRRLAAVT
jgi:4-hydroxybenzoate polyprenyltransferase